ncbi:MAG: aldolase [Kiritimatiellae bacterium]|nr:aldolase [Kiritimatiellia bacterium]
MKTNVLKKRLRAGRTVLGPFMKLADPAAVEVFAHAGFDFVIIDLEHGPLSIETAQNHVRAAEAAGITPVIRVAANNASRVLRALDIGAQGVQIPHVSCADDAERAVRAAKYHPAGDRGVCRFVRAADYSAMDRAAYFKAANRETLVIVHVEGLDGIRNLPDILAVKGVDVVFLGPYDLSQSCGVPGQVDDPKVVRRMKQAVRRARAAGVAVGTFVDTVANARKWTKAGVRYISYSVDVGILLDAAARLAAELRA